MSISSPTSYDRVAKGKGEKRQVKAGGRQKEVYGWPQYTDQAGADSRGTGFPNLGPGKSRDFPDF